MVSKQLQKKSVRFLLVFLLGILVLTAVSRVTSNLTIPKVSGVTLTRETLTDEMTFDAQVAKSDSTPIFTLAGQRIAQIYVHLNQIVAVDTPLFRLDMPALDKEISRLTFDIQKIELSIQSTKNQEAYNQSNQALKVKQAMDQYEALKETDASAADKQAAYNAWQIAKDDYPVDSLERETFQLDKNKLMSEKASLEQLKATNGVITSPTSGYVREISIGQGKLTTEEAALLIFSQDSDNNLVLQTEKNKQTYLQVGQSVRVAGVTSQDRQTVIEKALIIESSINPENSEIVDIKINLGQSDVKYGSTAQVIATKKSSSYPSCLPTSAVHETESGYYVLVANTKKTMLGEEIIAERINISVIDKTANFVAIKEAQQLDGREILLEINQPIQPDTKVRIVKKNEK